MTARHLVLPQVRPKTPADGMLCSMRQRIEILGLDLRGLTVVTEAATGAYACTAPIAAMAGAARVHAVARDTARYGSFDDAAAATLSLARAAGVADRITVSRALDPRMLAECDILTNSGHLRPICGETIARLPDRAVIALMFEAWEYREADLDLDACRERGIRIAAVNERHPAVGVFPFLGPLAVRLLSEAGLPPCGARIVLLCDNPFAPFIERGLTERGAFVVNAARVEAVGSGEADAVLVALDPSMERRTGRGGAARAGGGGAGRSAGAVLGRHRPAGGAPRLARSGLAARRPATGSHGSPAQRPRPRAGRPASGRRSAGRRAGCEGRRPGGW